MIPRHLRYLAAPAYFITGVPVTVRVVSSIDDWRQANWVCTGSPRGSWCKA